MADIFDLGLLRGFDSESGGKKARLKSDGDADIIIFPGVRYDRSVKPKGKSSTKKRVGGKSTNPPRSA